MSISISDFTVKADNGNKPSDFNDLFIQGVSLININAVVSTDADSFSNITTVINGIPFDTKHSDNQTFIINQSYRLKEAYIGGPMELKIEILAVDSNNNTGESSRTITVYPYQKPMLKPKSDEAAISVFRCSNSGVRDDSATSARLMAELKAQNAVGNVSLNPKVYIRIKTVNETWDNKSFSEVQYSNLLLQIISGSFSNSIGYNIQLKVEDELSSSEIYEFSLPSVLITFEAAPGGKKVAVGGTTNGLPDESFTSYWNATMKENLYVKKLLDVMGKSTFHDDVTIPTANITNANITNYNTLGDYVLLQGSFETELTHIAQNYLLLFSQAGINKNIWKVRAWKSGTIELWGYIPFFLFDNNGNYNSTVYNDFSSYEIGFVAYPSGVSFESIPFENASICSNYGENLLGLSLRAENSANQNTTLRSKSYSIFIPNNAISNADTAQKMFHLTGTLELFIIGKGTVDTSIVSVNQVNTDLNEIEIEEE